VWANVFPICSRREPDFATRQNHCMRAYGKVGFLYVGGYVFLVFILFRQWPSRPREFCSSRGLWRSSKRLRETPGRRRQVRGFYNSQEKVQLRRHPPLMRPACFGECGSLKPIFETIV
jgi:hypothetical protein